MSVIFRTLPIALIFALGACSGAPTSDATTATAAEQISTTSYIIATGLFVATDGNEDALKQALQDVEVGTQRECAIQYSNVHQNVDDPHEFLALGIWKDQDGFQAHGQSEYVQKFFAAAPSLLAAPGQMATYTAVRSLDLRHMNEVAGDPNAVYTFVTAKTATTAGKDDFVRLVTDVISISRKQDGNRFYDLLDASDPLTMVSYESWSSLDAEQAHLMTAPLTQFVTEISPDLAGPPLFKHFKGIAR